MFLYFYYFSDIPPVTDIPISLDVNKSDYDIIGEPESDIFQNYDEVSSTGSLLSGLSVENFLLSIFWKIYFFAFICSLVNKGLLDGKFKNCSLIFSIFFAFLLFS